MKLINLIFLLAVLSTIQSWAVDYSGSGEVHFTGYSTGHNFGGDLNIKPFEAQLIKQGTQEILVIPKIQISIQDMKTGNGSRDNKMYDMFNSKAFPELSGQMLKLNISEENLSGTQFEILLKIKNIEKPITATATTLIKSDDSIKFGFSFPVSLSDYELRPPSALFGMIKVKDRVDVNGTLDLLISR